MLAGLPVIATKCGGPEEFVVPQCGKLVQPKNIGQLTDAMKDMMENGPLDQTAIMSYARSSFSPEAIALKLTQLYASILTTQKFD